MKIKKIFLASAFIIASVSFSVAQNTQEYNLVDERGNKQGYWEKRYENGNMQYSGFFKNNKPIGAFKRYDRNGILKVELNYIENSDKVYTKFYYPGKILQAEGYYINQQKDSIWNYFSIENFLINKVPYLNNQKHGTEMKFFDNGSIYEKSEWKNGINDGITIRYYDNENVMMRIFYMNGMLDGEYNVYGLDENILIQGQYENNRREGKWTYFKANGHIESEINYIDGIADNQEKLDELEHEYLEQLEKNKGKFQDPTDQMYNAIPPQ